MIKKKISLKKDGTPRKKQSEKCLKNLRMFSDMTPEERKRASSKGAMKCHETRRERKRIHEILESLLREEVSINGGTNKITRVEAMCVALIRKALVGDIKAFELVSSMIGEKPKEELSLNVVSNNNVSLDAIKQIRKMFKESESNDG